MGRGALWPRAQSIILWRICRAPRAGSGFEVDSLRKINLDPLRTLAYVPRHAWPRLALGRAGSTNRDCWQGLHPEHSPQKRGSAGRLATMLAWRLADRRMLRSHSARHTRKCAAPSNRSRNPRRPSPPSDPLFSGAFFMRVGRSSTGRLASNRLSLLH